MNKVYSYTAWDQERLWRWSVEPNGFGIPANDWLAINDLLQPSVYRHGWSALVVDMDYYGVRGQHVFDDHGRYCGVLDV